MASWVIVRRADDEAVFETFNRATAKCVNLENYEVVPILEWLQRVNARAQRGGE